MNNERFRFIIYLCTWPLCKISWEQPVEWNKRDPNLNEISPCNEEVRVKAHTRKKYTSTSIYIYNSYSVYVNEIFKEISRERREKSFLQFEMILLRPFHTRCWPTLLFSWGYSVLLLYAAGIMLFIKFGTDYNWASSKIVCFYWFCFIIMMLYFIHVTGNR